jgi:hypothetical protein
MSHVEGACDIRRRNYQRKNIFSSVWVWTKIIFRYPVLIPFFFYAVWMKAFI